MSSDREHRESELATFEAGAEIVARINDDMPCPRDATWIYGRMHRERMALDANSPAVDQPKSNE